MTIGECGVGISAGALIGVAADCCPRTPREVAALTKRLLTMLAAARNPRPV